MGFGGFRWVSVGFGGFRWVSVGFGGFRYKSEVWCAYLKHDLIKLDQFNFEKVHLKFCKYYLGVNRKAVNDACLAELGRLTSKLFIEKRILTYLLHLQSLDTENLASKVYKLSLH